MKLKVFAHGKLYLLLIVYLLLATAYNLSLPLIKSDDDDEHAHFKYVQFIAVNHHLPATVPEREAAGYRARDGYPPFYHAVAGFLLSWVDGKDMVYWWDRGGASVLASEAMPQQFGNGVVIAVVQPALMDNFHQGFVLLWHLIRLFSGLLGTGTLGLTYFTTLNLFPGKQAIALTATATLAFIPRFVFVSANASDDNMLALLMACYLFFMVKVIKGHNQPLIFIAIGVLLGLSIVTKFSVALIPLTTVLFLAFLAWRRGWDRRVLVKKITITMVTTFLVSSWWFVFVVWNFNEIETRGTVAGVFNALVPDVASNLSGADLIDSLGGETAVRKKGDDSYIDWGIFFVKSFFESRFRMLPGGFPILVHLSGLAGAGLLLGVVFAGLIKTWRQSNEFQRTWLGLFVLHLLALLPLMLIRHSFNGFAPETAQGRHVLMSSASAVGVMLAIGWSSWAHSRPLNWLKPLLPGVLLFWSVTQLYYIYHYLPKPAPISAETATRYRVPEVEVSLNRPLIEGIELAGYSITEQPEKKTLTVTTVWVAHQPSQNDYLTELEFLDQSGQPVSGWIGHPAGGVYPTRAWGEGDRVYDEIAVPIHNLQPGEYILNTYLLDGYERPVRRVTDALFQRRITIEKPTKRLSNYKHIEVEAEEIGSFGVKYQVWPFEFFNFSYPLFRYRATIPIALEPDIPLSANQSVRMQLVAANGQIFTPLNETGRVKNFIVAGNWPAGLYRLNVQVLENDQILGESLTLPLVQVENEARSFTPPPMSREVKANFYNLTALLGYDMSSIRLKPGEVLSLKTYWQSQQAVNRRLGIFAHLYDLDNRVWATEDHPSPPYRGGTIVWTPGQVITDETKIWIDPQIPPGIYQVHVGLLADFGEDKQLRLPLVNGNKVTDITSVTLEPIKIGGPPEYVLANGVKPQHNRADTLGNTIKLSGYDAQIVAENIHLTLYWESAGITNVDYTTFVHIRDQTGQVIAQKDNPPAEGAYPTSLWDTGEVIRDKFMVPLPGYPAAKQYELLVGMYNPATGERLPLTNSVGDAISLTIFQPSPQP
jgi:hypothetical protein